MTQKLEPVWGAKEIAREIFPDAQPEQERANVRKTFHFLETGAIPARKVGSRWVAERGKLREFFTTAEPEPTM
jgi:hypothetical protein